MFLQLSNLGKEWRVQFIWKIHSVLIQETCCRKAAPVNSSKGTFPQRASLKPPVVIIYNSLSSPSFKLPSVCIKQKMCEHVHASQTMVNKNELSVSIQLCRFRGWGWDYLNLEYSDRQLNIPVELSRPSVSTDPNLWAGHLGRELNRSRPNPRPTSQARDQNLHNRLYERA